MPKKQADQEKCQEEGFGCHKMTRTPIKALALDPINICVAFHYPYFIISCSKFISKFETSNQTDSA